MFKVIKFIQGHCMQNARPNPIRQLQPSSYSWVDCSDRVPHRTSQADQEALVEAHNNYRRIPGASNMMKMVRDTALYYVDHIK